MEGGGASWLLGYTPDEPVEPRYQYLCTLALVSSEKMGTTPVIHTISCTDSDLTALGWWSSMLGTVSRLKQEAKACR